MNHLYAVHKQAEIIYGIRSQDCNSFGEDNTWDEARGELVILWEVLYECIHFVTII